MQNSSDSGMTFGFNKPNTEINKHGIKTTCFIQQITCQHRGNKSAEITAAIDNGRGNRIGFTVRNSHSISRKSGPADIQTEADKK